MIVLPDYKEMYSIMYRAIDDAIQILIEAQEECEELFFASYGQEEEEAPKE